MPQHPSLFRPTGATLLALAGLLVLGAPAYAAAPPGPYVGVGAGGYSLHVDHVTTGDPQGGRATFDGIGPMIRGFGGLRLTPYWAVEADYQWLSEAQDHVRGAHVNVDLRALTLSLRPILPLGEEVDLYGRAGWAWYDARVDASGTGLRVSTEGSGSDFTWGGGLDIHLGGGLTLRGDYSRIAIEHTDLDVVSAAAILRF